MNQIPPACAAAPWDLHVTVATIVVDGAGRLLLVEEHAAGHEALVLNQPAGHLEADESLQQAALRETREETGWDVRLTGFVGVYQWQAEDGRDYLRFAFVAEPVSHDATRELDEGIARALWMTPDELRRMQSRHRSPLVWRAVEDWLAGQRHPLELVQRLA